ncbi:MAG: hypothetical protein IT369_06510 [Candidatus Latescibacteria bacterium]|nr:hypothetical protein [Candidatus Latescibacterota bacterium]
MSRYRFAGPVLAGFLAILAAFPWLLGISYSKGNDFFYWLHFAWLVGPHLAEGTLPDWTMFSGCGQPVFNLDHLPDALALAFFTEIAGLEGGIRLFVITCHALAAAGLFRLSLALCGHRVSALLAALAYVLSWYFTRTADFYVYTSNLLQLALLPWMVLAYRGAAAGDRALQLAAGALTAVCITANPQMAIKVVGFCLAWLLVEPGEGSPRTWRQRVLSLGIVGAVAAWLSAFHIATALIHRREVYTLSERGTIWPRGWENFVAIPEYLWDLVATRLGGGPFFEVPRWAVIDSHYEGLGVVALAGYAWWAGRGGKRRLAGAIWGLCGLALLLFYAFSWGRATEWVGTPRNMLFIPTFCLALLAGCGHAQLHDRWRGRRRWLWRWGIPGLVLLELAGLKAAFYQIGPHHQRLEQIPQVSFWRQFSEGHPWGPGERFFTFKADLAFMLFPALTGRPTANIVHQRDYNPEYFSYQDAINKHFAAAGPYGAQPSEYLAVLGVRYIDLPRAGWVGRFAGHQRELLAHFRADPHLRQAAQRFPDWRDESWLRTPLDASAPEQVIFENQRAALAWVPGRVVAIVGDPRLGEKLFESLCLEPGYRFDRVLFLLCADPAELHGLEEELAGVLPADDAVGLPPSFRVLALDEVRDLLRQDSGAVPGLSLPPERWEEERLGFSLAPAPAGRFAGISLQRFADWHAADGAGQALRVFKTGAGLSAVYLPAGVAQVQLEYRRPAYKVWWRWFSLAGLAVVAVGLGFALRGRRSGGKGFGPWRR